MKHPRQEGTLPGTPELLQGSRPTVCIASTPDVRAEAAQYVRGLATSLPKGAALLVARPQDGRRCAWSASGSFLLRHWVEFRWDLSKGGAI